MLTQLEMNCLVRLVKNRVKLGTLSTFNLHSNPAKAFKGFVCRDPKVLPKKLRHGAYTTSKFYISCNTVNDVTHIVIRKR